MKRFKIPIDCYLKEVERFITEELALINMYLSSATHRAKHTALVGMLLTTELMIPDRFQMLLEGCQRLGLEDDVLSYLIEHTTVDETHAEDWLAHVVMPILRDNVKALPEIVLGVYRRLDTAAAVVDRLYTRAQNVEVRLKEKHANVAKEVV